MPVPHMGNERFMVPSLGLPITWGLQQAWLGKGPEACGAVV